MQIALLHNFLAFHFAHYGQCNSSYYLKNGYCLLEVLGMISPAGRFPEILTQVTLYVLKVSLNNSNNN